MQAIREILFFVLVLVGLWILSDEIDRLGEFADPIKLFYFWSGWISFGALTLGLFMRQWGRFFGHCALAFGLWHMMIFVYFDFYLDWGLMLDEILHKDYILVGSFGMLIMLFLGGVSFFGKFSRHCVYLVLVCITLSLVHILMIQKVLGWAYWTVIFGVVGVLAYKIWQAFCVFLQDSRD